MEHTKGKIKLSKEFADGWMHVCKCIIWQETFLDAEAIRFMNEMPSRIIRCADNCDALREACKKALTDTIAGELVSQEMLERALAEADNEG